MKRRRGRRAQRALAASVAVALAVGAAGAADARQAGFSPDCRLEGSTLVYSAGPLTSIIIAPDVIRGGEKSGAPPINCSPQGVTDIRVTGTDADEQVELDFAGLELPVQVALGGGADTLRFNVVNYEGVGRPAAIDGTGSVTVDMGAGKDSITSMSPVRRIAGTSGDGDDRADLRAAEGIAFDGGPGNDELDASAPGSIVLGGGLGDDNMDADGGNGTGPWRVDGGAGRDYIGVEGGNGWSVLGGDGDDNLSAPAQAKVSCGPGDDAVTSGTTDTSCPPHVTAPLKGARYNGKELRVAVRMNRRARVTLKVSTDPGRGGKAALLVKERTVLAGPGTTQLVLPLTPKGRTVLRSRASLRIAVLITAARSPNKTEGGRNISGGTFKAVRQG